MIKVINHKRGWIKFVLNNVQLWKHEMEEIAPVKCKPRQLVIEELRNISEQTHTLPTDSYICLNHGYYFENKKTLKEPFSCFTHRSSSLREEFLGRISFVLWTSELFYELFLYRGWSCRRLLLSAFEGLRKTYLRQHLKPKVSSRCPSCVKNNAETHTS